MNKKLLENLIDIREIVPKSFLILGTCLGAVRDKTFIYNSAVQEDVDLGIMSEDFSWDCVNDLIKKGFKLELVLGKRNYGLSLHFKRYNIKCDLLLFYKGDKNIWSISWFADKELQHEFTEEALKLEEHKLDGVKFPSLGAKYLEEYYGEDWMKPYPTNQVWNWWKGPKSIKAEIQDPHATKTGFSVYMKNV